MNGDVSEMRVSRCSLAQIQTAKTVYGRHWAVHAMYLLTIKSVFGYCLLLAEMGGQENLSWLNRLSKHRSLIKSNTCGLLSHKRKNERTKFRMHLYILFLVFPAEKYVRVVFPADTMLRGRRIPCESTYGLVNCCETMCGSAKRCEPMSN